MPRIQSPIRNRPIIIPKPIQRFNYTCLIALAIIVCSVLFCGIQDTLRYLKLITVVIIVIVVIVVIILMSLMKVGVRRTSSN